MIKPFKRFAMTALAFSTEVSAAINREMQIPQECLQKTDYFGQAKYGAYQFDQTSFIAMNIEKDFVLEEYNVCENDEGELASIKFSFMDTSSEELISLERAGPRTLRCDTQPFQNNGHINKVRFFKNEDKISGIALGYSQGKLIQRIGKATRMSVDFDFEWNQRVVGFYGSETRGDGIILLGVIYQDIRCTQQITQKAEEFRRSDEPVDRFDKQSRSEEESSLLDDVQDSMSNALSSVDGQTQEMVEYVTKETRENFMEDVGTQVFYTVLAIIILVLGLIVCTACYSKKKKMIMKQTARANAESKKSMCGADQRKQVQMWVH